MSRPLVIERNGPAFGETILSPETGKLPDGILLNRFMNERSEEAFEALVLRHGPGVLRVCRNWLGQGQDADDACQATFLVLIHRATEIRRSDDIGVWLRGVARRVAARAKMRITRRRVREGASVDVREIAGRDHPETEINDMSPVLRAEVDRLPEKYRRPIELCYWEGLTSEQAAARLACPTGTLKWRLSRAREILRGRLSRFGISLSLLFFWRLPQARADVSAGSLTEIPGSVSVGPISSGSIEGILSQGFVRDTVALAAFVRDSPPSFMNPGSRPPRKRWRLAASHGLGNPALLVLLIVLALFLSIRTVSGMIPQIESIDFSRDLGSLYTGVDPVRSCH